MADDYEIWKNASKGSVWITRLDGHGKKMRETVRGGGTVKISTEDRELQSQLAADEAQDIFKNGRMTPVKLLEGSESAKEIASNPNMKSESDLRDMFSLHWKTFEANVKSISNLMTIERLRDFAEDEDVDATVKQMEIIDARMAELNPVQVSERESIDPRTVQGNFGGAPA